MGYIIHSFSRRNPCLHCTFSDLFIIDLYDLYAAFLLIRGWGGTHTSVLFHLKCPPFCRGKIYTLERKKNSCPFFPVCSFSVLLVSLSCLLLVYFPSAQEVQELQVEWAQPYKRGRLPQWNPCHRWKLSRIVICCFSTAHYISFWSWFCLLLWYLFVPANIMHRDQINK